MRHNPQIGDTVAVHLYRMHKTITGKVVSRTGDYLHVQTSPEAKGFYGVFVDEVTSVVPA